MVCCTSAVCDGSREFASKVLHVVDTSVVLTIKVDVGHVHLAGTRGTDEHTVVTAVDSDVVSGCSYDSGDLDTCVGWTGDIDTIEVTGCEVTTNGDTCVSSSDLSVLEGSSSTVTEVVAKIAWVVTYTGNKVKTVLVVVCTVVENIDVHGYCRDRRITDIDDWEGHSSTFTRVHPVTVCVVETDVVVSTVSVVSFRRLVDTLTTVIGVVVVTPVVVWVGTVGWAGISVNFAPAESELVRIVVVTRVGNILLWSLRPEAVHVVHVSVKGSCVARSPRISVVVAVP